MGLNKPGPEAVAQKNNDAIFGVFDEFLARLVEKKTSKMVKFS